MHLFLSMLTMPSSDFDSAPDMQLRTHIGSVQCLHETAVYIASEEAAISVMEPDAENIYAPAGGEPVIVKVKEGAY